MTKHSRISEYYSKGCTDDSGFLDRTIVGQSEQAVELKRFIRLVAPSNASVLIKGETGTGKELVARALHDLSGRDGAMVTLNCAAIPADLLESELFGHDKGAFTGAHRERAGRIEAAHQGTLFLDEIGDMPPALQAKLLRVLETRRVQPLGGGPEVEVDFRLIAATHRNLEDRIREGAFRADLFYRLAVVPMSVPSLADRRSDIPLLVRAITARNIADNPASVPPIFDPSAMNALVEHDWIGNVRELRNVVERALAFFPGKVISAREVRENLFGLRPPVGCPAETIAQAPQPQEDDLPAPDQYRGWFARRDAIDMRTHLRDIEAALIEAALAAHDGIVVRAAAALGLSRTTLIDKMRKLSIERPVQT